MAQDTGHPPAAFLNLRHIDRHFGPVRAVDDVSLGIAEGEFLVMLGPSGSGKTTLLRIIAGFETADAGRIEIGGRDLSRVPPDKRNIGVVFQNLALFPHMSVFRNIAFGLEMRGVAAAEIAARVGEALDMVRLGAMADRMPSQLSGGQQQRVALARALVTRPNVLLLDEPLSALDRDLRSEMQYEIRRIQQALGITAVMVTHDQEEAMIMGDRIAVLRNGRLSQMGSGAEIYRHPKSAFIARFMGAANILPVTEIATEAEGFRARLDPPGGGSVLCGHMAEPEGGGTVAVIRPEDIAVGPAAEGCANRFSGRVAERTYLGGQSRLVVDLAEGFSLSVMVPSRGAPERGAELTVGWAPEMALLVPA